MVTISPYGSWASPISVDDITGATVGLVGGAIDGGDVYWAESHASQKGRASVWRLTPDGTRTELTPDHYVRSTVHEYGGGAWAVHDGTVVFSQFPMNVVYALSGGDREPRPLTAEGPLRFGGFSFTPDGRSVVCVREDHTDSDIDCINTLVILDVASASSEPQPGVVIAEGADFYGPASVAPDGRVAWFEWDHPNMPWDSTRVMVGHLDGREPVLVGGSEGVSAVYPRWDADGSLVLLSDESGYWNFHRWDGSTTRPLHDDPYDFCGPAWILSGAPYALLDDGIGCSWRVDGVSHLGVLTRDGELEERPVGAVEVAVEGGGPACSVVELGFADRPTELATYDWSSGQVTTIRRASERVPDPAMVARAEAVTWEGPQGLVHAWYYPPTNPDFAAPEGELPPVVVLSHGGPTSFSTGLYSASDQFWTSRGIGILDVNYGGSSGYGRAYRDRLQGTWGVVDVQDCADGATTLGDRGMADPERLAIKGGSAGGYTTLQALVTSAVFSAGISLYGIGDLAMLATDTHKFESRYLDGLIGPYPERKDLYEERSPLFHVDQLSCPMLILQGTDDKVVPPNQAEAMADAVREKGLPVALVMFEGEGHGFRRADSIKASYDAQLSFLGQVFGFTPAGDVPVLPVENL